ncbi:MAG: hypothetical protein RMK65_05830, partial [Anaerolineae bacterium]|nr:hypothetical protein [Anaerolineae bacterium]
TATAGPSMRRFGRSPNRNWPNWWGWEGENRPDPKREEYRRALEDSLARLVALLSEDPTVQRLILLALTPAGADLQTWILS